MLSSIASNSVLRQINGTPNMSQDSLTLVSESPYSNTSGRKSLSFRAAKVGISGSTEKKDRIFHPVFAANESVNESFETFAPATQQDPVGKVQAWLTSEQSPNFRKNKRRSNVRDVSNYLLRESQEHVPYRPPSFQDYSSDSAKALLAKFEDQQTSDDKNLEKSDKVDGQEGELEIQAMNLDDQLDDSVEIDSKANVSMNKVLEGVTAFVEVRSKNENRSDVVIDQLLALGALVVPRLINKCTHVVFKEGSLTTYNKAKKMNMALVSVNWIEACKKEKIKVDEHMYPPMNQEKYDSPGLFPKLRKTKSLQPKSDEEFSKLIDRKVKKKLAAENNSPIPTTPKGSSPKVRSFCHAIRILYEHFEFYLGSQTKAESAIRNIERIRRRHRKR